MGKAGKPVSRRRFLSGGVGLAAAGALGGTSAGALGAASAGALGGVPGGFSAERIAALDAINLARSARRSVAGLYQPFTANIIHIFGYGQSLADGFLGVPVLSSTQPYDNLMIGEATRAAKNDSNPATTTWLPAGAVGADGIYPFNPMIATQENLNTDVTSGETPGEGAVNFFRNRYLERLGLPQDPSCRFVLTNCAIGGKTIAELSKGADPDIYNRLIQAAQYVKQTAESQGLTYQVGAMIWTQGEQDVQYKTTQADYTTLFQQLQQDFLTDVVHGIAGQPHDTVLPWFCHQPDWELPGGGFGPYQALLDLAITPGSNLYLAGPVYQYPNWNVHMASNGYRWHGQQVGKAMSIVLLEQEGWLPMYMTGATVSGMAILVSLNVPYPGLLEGTAYARFDDYVYPNLGFEVFDDLGAVPVTSARIAGGATVELILGRALSGAGMLQSGYNGTFDVDWGTNLCDVDPTVADSDYTYVDGVQSPNEDVASWNGEPLIGEPYPLNNYLAVGQVPILVD